MIQFAQTEKSVRKLIDLLRCDNCNCTLHMPFTTGICPHTLCNSCCNLSTEKNAHGSTCPVCSVPVRPCDLKPHPQLSSLVLVARRLIKLFHATPEGDVMHVAEPILLTANHQSNKALSKDDIHFLHSDEYCRVDSPSPSSVDISVKSNRLQLVKSPIECSIRVQPEPTVLLKEINKHDKEEKASETKPSSTKGPELAEKNKPRKSSFSSKLNITIKPVNKRKLRDIAPPSKSTKLDASTAVYALTAPLATPETSLLLNNSGIDKNQTVVGNDQCKSTFNLRSRSDRNLRKTVKNSPNSTNLTVRQRLSSFGTSVNSKGESSLHRAAIKNDIAQLKYLLSSGISANLRDNAGWTPLHEAALRGYTEASECLLTNGATVDLPGGPDLETALHDAVVNGHLSCCKLLLDYQANPDFTNALGISPLQASNNLLSANCHINNQKNKKKQAKSKFVTSASVQKRINELLQLASLNKGNTKQLDTSTGDGSGMVIENAPPLQNLPHSVLFIERRRLRPVLVGTGLNRLQKAQFVRVASLIHACVVEEISPEVTHLITGTLLNSSIQESKSLAQKKNSKQIAAVDVEQSSKNVAPSDVTCPRTLKFLFAVLQGCWVLSFDWIETCSLVKSRVEEEGFEVMGCSTAPTSGASRKARLSREAGASALFYGFRICLLGNFEYPTPGRADLISLAQTGGATVFSRDISSAARLAYLAIGENSSVWSIFSEESEVNKPIEFEVSTSVVPDQLLVLFDPRSSTTFECNNIVESALRLLRRKPGINNESNIPPIQPVPATWLMDCIAEYAIVPLKN